MEFVYRITSGFWNRQYAISIEIRITFVAQQHHQRFEWPNCLKDIVICFRPLIYKRIEKRYWMNKRRCRLNPGGSTVFVLHRPLAKGISGAGLSEICSVLMRNIYVSWKSKHFVSDYGKKSSQKLNIFPAPASEFNWEIYVSFLSNSLTHTPRNMSWIGHFLVFPPICSLIPPTHTPFRELRKISSCITYSTQCAATNLVNNKLLIWTLIS